MSHLLTSSLCSAALAIFVCLPAHAQTPAKGSQKTIGGKAASGKLMTKDELRTCFTRRDALNENARKVDADRAQLDAERVEILKEGEAIKVDRETIDKRLAAVRDWEGRVKQHSAAIEAFNKRMAEYNDAPANRKKGLEAELKTEREQLEKVTAQLKSDEAERVPVYQASVKSYNDRAAARDAKVTSWNERNAAAVKSTDSHQEARLLWASECANRPYREDDEIAIKAGK
jgi:chromosome segregation ATPase